jgi:hypothetical protein
MYLDVSCMYLDCILMCPVHIHQDTSRYIKIHQDTFVSCCLWHFSCILPRGMYPPSKIHLGYISDTMYLVFQIHDTQDTFKIHSGYVWDISRYTSRYVSRANLEPYLRPRLDTPKPPRYVSCMYIYPLCIPHVFRMYPACILITSEDTCISHVSRMSQFISDTSLSGCILDAFEIHVSHHVSWMYPACILITLADTFISHVSRMYLASQIRTSS